MNEQTTMYKKPMPLADFLAAIGKLAKKGQWLKFRQAVQKRKEYYENNPTEGNF